MEQSGAKAFFFNILQELKYKNLLPLFTEILKEVIVPTPPPKPKNRTMASADSAITFLNLNIFA